MVANGRSQRGCFSGTATQLFSTDVLDAIFAAALGGKHLQLTGMSGKKFLTEQAQIYSQEFAESLMLAFVSPKPTHT